MTAAHAVRTDATRGAVADRVRMEVLDKWIESIAGKMQNTLLWTARSGVINNGRDSSCCILTGGAHDVAEGYVTLGRAKAIYGVMFGADGAVDEVATSRVRAQHPTV